MHSESRPIVPYRTDASLYRISLRTFELETIFELVKSTPSIIRALCPSLKLIAYSWGLQIHITNWETNESVVVSTEDEELEQLVCADMSLVSTTLNVNPFCRWSSGTASCPCGSARLTSCVCGLGLCSYTQSLPHFSTHTKISNFHNTNTPSLKPHSGTRLHLSHL